MRMVFGLLSLLFVVAIIGVLARKQLGAATPIAPAASTSSIAGAAGTPSQQVEQFKQAVESTMQQARPMPDEK